MLDSNVLSISKKEQKAYLPYYYDKVAQIYRNSNGVYSSIQEVIEDLYIVPLEHFKHTAISRFREAIYLARKKEHLSLIYTLELAFELMFNSKLNPIIISACRNLDELDIYLDCLEENELEDFDCFKIKFL